MSDIAARPGPAFSSAPASAPAKPRLDGGFGRGAPLVIGAVLLSGVGYAGYSLLT